MQLAENREWVCMMGDDAWVIPSRQNGLQTCSHKLNARTGDKAKAERSEINVELQIDPHLLEGLPPTLVDHG